MSQKANQYLKNADSLISDLNKPSKIKYLSKLTTNYAELIRATIDKNIANVPESMISKLLPHIKEISECVRSLSSAGFFKEFGEYTKNQNTIQKISTLLNESMLFVKPLLEKPVYSINLGEKVLEAIDAAVKESDTVIKEIKQQQKRPPSEFKKNVNEIQDELTYIFWFKEFSKENTIEIVRFVPEMRRLWTILGKNPKKINMDKILLDVDEEKTSAIEPTNVFEFLNFALIHPSNALDYEFLEENEEDEGSENEKTMKRVKKKPKNQKNMKPKEEAKSDDDDNDEKKQNTILVNRGKNVGKVDISKYTPNTSSQDKPKKPPFSFGGDNLIVSVYLQQHKPLMLRVIETNENTTNFLAQNDLITITNDTFQINDSGKKQLSTKYITKFGRETFVDQLQSDIKLVDNKNNEISRKQFQILGNDFVDDVGVYKVVCLAPPPKNDTGFKVTQNPYPLVLDSIISFTDKEVFQVDTIFDGEAGGNAENISNVFMNPQDKDDENDTELTKKRKNDKKKQKKADREAQENLKKQAISGSPFIIFDGLLETSEIHGKKLRIDHAKYPKGFVFGRDYLFQDEKRNTKARVFFDKTQGKWFIQSHKVTDKEFKIFDTRVSLWRFSQVEHKVAKSDPYTLKVGDVINVFGFSFLVEDL